MILGAAALQLTPPAEAARQVVTARQRAWAAWNEARTPSGKRAAALQDVARVYRVDLWQDYDPHDKQYAFHRSKARFKSLCAGRRGGKTYAAAREFVRRILDDLAVALASGRTWTVPAKWHPAPKPFLHYWAIAPTYALGLIQQRELTEILQGHPEIILRWNANEIWLVGGILIEFKSADNPLRLVGAGLSGAWLDEAARAKGSVWNDSIRPALSDRRGWALFSTTPTGRNWFHSEIWVHGLDGEPGYENFHFVSADNVRAPDLAAEVEEARRTMPPKYFARNYLASFDAFDGQIYEEFSRTTHVIRPDRVPIHRFRQQVGGGDYGFSNAGALYRCGIDGDGTWYVWHEDYARRVPSYVEPPGDSWVRRALIAQRAGVSRQWWDPSNPGHIDALASHGVNAQAADNAVNAGIQSIATLLHIREDTGRPSLYIAADCPNLITQIEGYHYEIDKDGRETEKPAKKDDHGPDALRYGVHSEAVRGGVPQVHHLSIVR